MLLLSACLLIYAFSPNKPAPQRSATTTMILTVLRTALPNLPRFFFPVCVFFFGVCDATCSSFSLMVFSSSEHVFLQPSDTIYRFMALKRTYSKEIS